MKKTGIILIVVLLGIMRGHLQAFESETEWGILDIHGFISQGGMLSEGNNFFADTKDGTVQFNEFGINVSTELTDRLRTGMQLFSRDLGDLGNNEIMIDWAYGDYRWKDWLGFRSGKIKIPNGLYNETRDVDMLRTNVFLPQSIYPEIMRDTTLALLGSGIFGHLSLASLGSINYELQYGEMDIETDSSMAEFIKDEAEMDVLNIDAGHVFTGALEWNTPLEGLRIKGGIITLDLAMTLKTTEQTPWISEDLLVGLEFPFKMDNMRIITLSAEYAWGNLVLATEYEKSQSENVFATEERKSEGDEGYYVSAAYRFTNWFELGVYYSVYYADVDDRDGKDLETQGEPKHKAWQKELVLTTRFDLNEYWTLKIEGHIVNGTANIFLQDNPDGLEEYSFLLAFKTTYSF
jgi:hypothetical protein